MAHIEYFFATTSPFTYLAGTRMEEVAERMARRSPTARSTSWRCSTAPAARPRTNDTRAARLPPAGAETPVQEAWAADEPRPAVPGGEPRALLLRVHRGGQGRAAAIWASWSMPSPAPSGATCATSPRMTRSAPAWKRPGSIPGWRGWACCGGRGIHRNLEDAVNAGAFGAPFYIVDGTEKFWGQDRIEDLDLHLSGEL
jgi:hypothetical protein